MGGDRAFRIPRISVCRLQVQRQYTIVRLPEIYFTASGFVLKIFEQVCAFLFVFFFFFFFVFFCFVLFCFVYFWGGVVVVVFLLLFFLWVLVLVLVIVELVPKTRLLQLFFVATKK